MAGRCKKRAFQVVLIGSCALEALSPCFQCPGRGTTLHRLEVRSSTEYKMRSSMAAAKKASRSRQGRQPARKLPVWGSSRPGSVSLVSGLVCIAVWNIFGSGPEEKEKDKMAHKMDQDLRKFLLQALPEQPEQPKRTTDWWPSWLGAFWPGEKEKKEEKRRSEGNRKVGNDIETYLAAVKSSVFAAILGTTGQEAQAPVTPPKDSAPFLGMELPNPEGWLDSARDAAAAAAATISGAGQERVEEPSKEPAKEQEWWESARDAVMGKPDSLPEPNEKTADPEAKGASGLKPAAAKAPPQVVEERPFPTVPGMEAATLIVRVDIEANKSKAVAADAAQGVAALMAKSGGQILESMGQEGWKVVEIDAKAGLYDLSLPAVRYEMAGGVITIPAPLFRATIFDTFRRDGDAMERLQGDLVLQNGKDIFTLELGFPFRTSFKISAAGWTRARVGWEQDAISASNYVEVGIQLPRIPGLSPLLEYFVKNYGTESTMQCAVALSKGADRLPRPLQEAAKQEEEENKDESQEWWAIARDSALSLGTSGGQALGALRLPFSEEERDDSPPSPASSSTSPAPKREEVFVEELLQLPPPLVPGMDAANLMVQADIDPQKSPAKQGRKAVERLMRLDCGAVLSMLGSEGWTVQEIDKSQGIFELSLPAVRVDLPGAVVTIPRPCFRATMRNSYKRTGSFTERLVGDLVLQNGKDILTLTLSLPFSPKFTISAAGWTRASIGWEDDEISVSNSVEVGLQAPGVPGLQSILQLFVRNYGEQATRECADCLARSADQLPQDALSEAQSWFAAGVEAVAENVGQGWEAVLESMPKIPGRQDDSSDPHQGPGPTGAKRDTPLSKAAEFFPAAVADFVSQQSDSKR